jgi:hypothetical protein
MAKNSIKIGGKLYYPEDTGYTKLKAKSKADKLRNQGYNVRVIKDKDYGDGSSYALFRRHKGKK